MRTLGLAWGDSPDGFHEIVREREKPAHRGARQLLEAWQAREGRFVVGRDVPSRGLAKVLSGLALFQPILHGDFRVRLAGLALRRRFGRDVTGEKLSQVLDAAHFVRHAIRLRALLDTGTPLVVETQVMAQGRLQMCYEMVALRVFAPDGETPWVMSGMFFHDWRL